MCKEFVQDNKILCEIQEEIPFIIKLISQEKHSI